MTILGIDGALGAFSVAVVGGETVLAARAETGNVALERGLSMVSDVLRAANATGADVDRIAAGCGPGTFTGLRIALSYAKSLAQAWRRPLVAVDSFDLLEYGAGLTHALAVVQGRPGVVSVRLRSPAGIERDSGWTADVLDRLEPSLRRYTGDEPLPVVGAPKDVLSALAERRIVVRQVIPLVTPAAASAALAARALAPADSVHAVRADYGELPPARVPRSL